MNGFRSSLVSPDSQTIAFNLYFFHRSSEGLDETLIPRTKWTALV